MHTDNAQRQFTASVLSTSHTHGPLRVRPRPKEAELCTDPVRRRRREATRCDAAFTRIDLLAVLIAAALLLGVAFPLFGGTGPASGRTQCLSNFRRLMLASQLYAGDNRDYMPFPTWGSDLTGPDGWAYATANRGRLPGQPAAPPPLKREAQKPWRSIGQLWAYLNDGAPYECPDDLIVQDPGALLFRQRSCQITSYQMNGMIAGLPDSGAGLNGVTYPISRFLPADLVFVEDSEAQPFFFNDGGTNPQGGEMITTRHGAVVQTSLENQATTIRDRGGNAGRIDGGAEFISLADFARDSDTTLQNGRRTRVLCYPTK